MNGSLDFCLHSLLCNCSAHAHTKAAVALELELGLEKEMELRCRVSDMIRPMLGANYSESLSSFAMACYATEPPPRLGHLTLLPQQLGGQFSTRECDHDTWDRDMVEHGGKIIAFRANLNGKYDLHTPEDGRGIVAGVSS